MLPAPKPGLFHGMMVMSQQTTGRYYDIVGTKIHHSSLTFCMQVYVLSTVVLSEFCCTHIFFIAIMLPPIGFGWWKKLTVGCETWSWKHLTRGHGDRHVASWKIWLRVRVTGMSWVHNDLEGRLDLVGLINKSKLCVMPERAPGRIPFPSSGSYSCRPQLTAPGVLEKIK